MPKHPPSGLPTKSQPECIRKSIRKYSSIRAHPGFTQGWIQDLHKAGFRIYTRPDSGFTQGWIQDLHKARFRIYTGPDSGFTQGRIQDLHRAGFRIYTGRIEDLQEGVPVVTHANFLTHTVKVSIASRSILNVSSPSSRMSAL